ncbi:MAG: hypothetical protein OQK93_04250, partial [Gammaproteobacteria bacterium]|nr:hypothetical protein [Gammaproteobacteria bacterium]
MATTKTKTRAKVKAKAKPAKRSKTAVKADALHKKLDAHTESLSTAHGHATTAVAIKTAEAKKLLSEVKRHTKKKATLTKRVKTATAKLKKEANA